MHSPLEQFTVKPIIQLELMGYDISFTNASLFMVLSLIAIFLFLGMSVRKVSLNPSRLQAAGEMSYNFISDMIYETVGEKAKQFIPLVFTLFMFILSANLIGMIPFSFTVTSHIIVTFAMAIFVFIGVTILGFVRHGWHYLSLFLPAGVPTVMAPLMIVIELVAYLVRPVSLSIRLAANMTAGHIVMKVIASFVIMGGFIIGPIPFAFLTLLTGFEIFVAVLQAYIFAILSCVYLSDAINLH